MSDTIRRPSNSDRTLLARLLGRVGRASSPRGAGGRPEVLCESLEGRQMFSLTLTGTDLPGPATGTSTNSDIPSSAFVLEDRKIGAVRWGQSVVMSIGGQYVIELSEGGERSEARAAAAAADLARKLGIEIRDVKLMPGNRYVQFDTSARPTKEQMKAAIAQLPGIARVEPNVLYQPTRVPNDPQFSQQYWLQNTGQPVIPGTTLLGTVGADIHVTEAWEITVGSKDTIVAVIDSGVQWDHPDLAANIYSNPSEIAGNGIDDDGNGFVDDIRGWDFGELDNNPYDDSSAIGYSGGGWLGHGTGVAGMIGAVGNNGIGTSGVNWDVSILPMKIALNVFFDDGQFVVSTTTSAAIAGAYDYITMMANRGVNIVAANASYGAIASRFYEDATDGDFGLERAAITRLTAAGVTFVAAAGNSAIDNDSEFSSYPASYDVPGLISVAATDYNDRIASYSNYGAETVDLAAPGVFVWDTAVGSGYDFFGGTSAASPTVAGAVALLRSVRPDASAVEVRNALINSTDPLPTLQGKMVSGGRLNVARAIQALNVAGPVVRSVSPGPVTLQIDQNQTPATPINKVQITFNKSINSSLLATDNFRLLGAGSDGLFDTSDDIVVPVSGVSVDGGKTVVLNLNLSGPTFPSQRLRIDSYRLTLRQNLGSTQQIRDTDGNFLNGNAVSGQDQNYNFRVVNISGDNEPNDTTGTATPVTFTASGQATFTGVTLGNGLAGPLDVDIYKIEMPRGGQLTAEIRAARRAAGSTLDSYIRLFDASGVQITANDQFYGSDSYFSYYVTTGGVYYVGVSGFGNASYSPLSVATGTSQSTGVYDLTIGASLSGDDRASYDATIPSGGTRIPFDVANVATLGQTTATIAVTDNRSILDVNVRLTLTHQFDGDLRISLRSPSGREVILSNKRGGSGQNYTGTLFDDESATTIASGAAPFSGTFKPDAPLSGFDGQSALGTWTLIINDTDSLSTGTLLAFGLDFTLSNNIFGPFETNDTLTTATILTEVNGSGTAQAAAFIGDGGFGTRDRDIFRFTAQTGSSLTARVTAGSLNATGTAITTAGSSLNSALRLFDSTGRELNLSNPDGTRNSLIENFVFSEGGTYYLAVSESANVTYTANDVNSSSVSLTTGNYVLQLTLAAGVSDPALVVTGEKVSVGIGNNSATYARSSTGDSAVGLKYNGTEFLYASSEANPVPTSFFAGVAGGSTFRNNANAASGSGLPFSVADQSDTFNRRVVTRANFTTGQGELRVERNFSYGVADSFIAIDVYLTNAASGNITGVQWMEAFNPDQGRNLSPTGQTTANDLSGYDGSNNPRLAVGSYSTNAFPGGLSIALAASQTSAFTPKANIVDSAVVIRDPQQVRSLSTNDPNGLSSDSLLAMSFDLGTIAAGATQHVRYYIMFANSAAGISELYSTLNSANASGHLPQNPASPADEAITQPDGSTVSLPKLPFRVYYPEGFANAQTYTFVPVVNQTNQTNRVTIIARYENSPSSPLARRDHVIADLTLAAGERGGITITNPDLYAANTQLVDKDRPYALEIRSEAPVSATFSHYDLFLLAGGKAAIGQAFTTRISETWTLGSVTKGSNVSDFILFMNTSGETVKVTTTFYPQTTGATASGSPITITQEIGAYRRSGVNVNQDFGSLIPAGTYGVRVTSAKPIVASLSHYETAGFETTASAYGYLGVPSTGTAAGVIPEGQSGLNSSDERLAVLNTGSTSTTVTFTFIFTGGSSFRSTLVVPGASQRELRIEEIPNFPLGQPYAVRFSATSAVTVVQPSRAFSNGLANSFADRAYALWGFGEGFRPANNATNVREYLRLYNPNLEDVLVEITIRYDNNLGTETTNWRVSARGLSEINIHDLVTGTRRTQDAYYGLSVKAAKPIVAYMGHYDPFFPGAFGTLGTPSGQSVAIS